jgi:hypothetical protein
MICPTCPIYLSCLHRHTNPVTCLHRPAPIVKKGVMPKEYRHRILMPSRLKFIDDVKTFESTDVIRRMSSDEHMIRLETCGGCP